MATVFACIQQSQRISTGDLDLITKACGAQLAEDFAPAWERVAAKVGIYANVPCDTDVDRFVASYFRDARPDDPEGALAYHWVNDEGRPEVIVLVDRILGEPGARRDDVCTAAGHEFIETEGDLYANEFSDRGDGQEEPHELCDRVQGFSYTKTIGGESIQVTDFLLPQAFNDAARPGAKFDFCGRLKHAREIGAGGYTVTRPIGGGESTVFGNVKAAIAFSRKTLERHGVDVALLQAIAKPL